MDLFSFPHLPQFLNGLPILPLLHVWKTPLGLTIPIQGLFQQLRFFLSCFSFAPYEGTRTGKAAAIGGISIQMLCLTLQPTLLL